MSSATPDNTGRLGSHLAGELATVKYALFQ